MKIAFSTLGCPDFSWVDIYSMAKDFHFDGIEIRGLGREIKAVSAAPFTPAQIKRTIKKLNELDLEIPCLSSGCGLKFKENREQNIAEITEYIELASQLSTRYIRILADREAHVTGEVDDQFIVDLMKELAEIAAPKEVTLLVETNGVYADT
ncbi:MAG: TIM barrel protein, partial [Clostridia bacterium]|nr:TIM barrel protein [Clostridia bacterium]